jgi:hypothetical protein
MAGVNSQAWVFTSCEQLVWGSVCRQDLSQSRWHPSTANDISGQGLIA